MGVFYVINSNGNTCFIFIIVSSSFENDYSDL